MPTTNFIIISSFSDLRLALPWDFSVLADCYRTGDPLASKRIYTYRDDVRFNMGMGIGLMLIEFVWSCNWIHNSMHDVSHSYLARLLLSKGSNSFFFSFSQERE